MKFIGGAVGGDSKYTTLYVYKYLIRQIIIKYICLYIKNIHLIEINTMINRK
jgi:hypothetical protein